MPTAPRRQSIALDLLRVAAALIVLLVHVRGSSFVEFGALPATQQTPIVAFLFLLTRFGSEAVMVFFVLSGFLVGGQIITRVIAGTFDVVDYAIDRVTRILPPLLAAVALTLVVNSVFFGLHTDVWVSLCNVLGLNGILSSTIKNNAPLWSLSYEIWFYVLAGAVAYVVSQRTTLAAALVIGLAAVIFSILEARMLLYWALGAFAAKITITENRAVALILGVLMVIIGAAFYQIGIASKSFAFASWISASTAQAIICCGLALTLPILSSEAFDNILSRFKGVAGTLSSFSYTLYVIHYPVNSALDLFIRKSEVISTQGIALFFVRILICVAVSVVFYFIFERNTKHFRKAMRDWREATVQRKTW